MPRLLLIALCASFLLLSCDKSKQPPDFDTQINQSLRFAVKQYRALNKNIPEGKLPRSIQSTNNDHLVMTSPDSWTSGFFPGSLWYLYEFSQSQSLKKMARQRTRSIENQKNNDGTHDIGFEINCSFGNAFRMTGDSAYAKVMMQAAQTLTHRYDKDVGAIRSWGEISDQTGPYKVIIDNMMNLELLFWATRFSGDSTYANIAIHHADKTLKNHFRSDGSSYHVVEYDPQTGKVLDKHTAQGFADSSAWARGQSWGLYGFTMSYRETGFKRYLKQANIIADFLLNKAGLPDDDVPYWDYDAAKAKNGKVLRDASAGAIMASAFLELSQYVDSSRQKRYKATAKKILKSLSGSKYRSKRGEDANFLLKHSVGSKPGNSEVDVPLIYADYYYLEAMMRWRALKKAESIPVLLH